VSAKMQDVRITGERRMYEICIYIDIYIMGL
jgi:hypothetical protein